MISNFNELGLNLCAPKVVFVFVFCLCICVLSLSLSLSWNLNCWSNVKCCLCLFLCHCLCLEKLNCWSKKSWEQQQAIDRQSKPLLNCSWLRRKYKTSGIQAQSNNSGNVFTKSNSILLCLGMADKKKTATCSTFWQISISLWLFH